MGILNIFKSGTKSAYNLEREGFAGLSIAERELEKPTFLRQGVKLGSATTTKMKPPQPTGKGSFNSFSQKVDRDFPARNIRRETISREEIMKNLGRAPSNSGTQSGAFSNIYDGPKQGLWNKTKSIGQSVFNGMHSNEFESTVRRTGAYALGGAAGGLAYGMAGNVLSGGQLANTDPHMVRNAMFTGAMAGAFGMAKSGLGSMVRSQNHNITPFMKSFATKTMKAMDHPATSGAFFIAGFGGMSDSHLTRSISQVNFSGQPSR